MNRVCKYCGKGGLAWRVHKETGWRLYDPKNNNQIHTCKAPIDQKAMDKLADLNLLAKEPEVEIIRAILI